MKIIEYLNGVVTDHPKDTLQEMKEEFGIKYSHDERFPELYVLNYSQIDSEGHKYDPMVMECRSLVLEYKGGWHVVSRAMDRFFNLGEEGAAKVDVKECTAYEKMDGSLISVFFHENYGWLYRTKSMIMPECSVEGKDVTWKYLIEKALGVRYPTFEITSRPESTFIMELTSPMNRVVTAYTEECMTLLAIRNNSTGAYINPASTGMIATRMHMRRPFRWEFSDEENCKEFVASLPDLREGVVLYNPLGVPLVKVKNPAYVSAHYMRGECNPTPKRILKMIDDNEVAEFLAIFPEFSDLINPYVDAIRAIVKDAEDQWDKFKNIGDDRLFAEAIKSHKVKWILFPMRQGREPLEVFNSMLNTSRLRMIKEYL